MEVFTRSVLCNSCLQSLPSSSIIRSAIMTTCMMFYGSKPCIMHYKYYIVGILHFILEDSAYFMILVMVESMSQFLQYSLFLVFLVCGKKGWIEVGPRRISNYK